MVPLIVGKSFHLKGHDQDNPLQAGPQENLIYKILHETPFLGDSRLGLHFHNQNQPLLGAFGLDLSV